MLFTEIRFFLFFAFVFCIYWAIPSNRSRKGFLLAGSYLFYAAWDWRFLSLIIISTIIDFFAAKGIDSSDNNNKRKFLLTLSLCANLGMLGFFKYFNFFAESLSSLGETLGIEFNYTTLNIVLPVGISFFTFQTMSYTIDVYRRRIKAEQDWLDIAFFVAFFPQLVAGPIVRAIDFLPQLLDKKQLSNIAFKSLLLLFLIGFIKKACISDNIAPYVDLIFENPQNFNTISIWTGVTLYAAQIYCDFSGYTDMAIACAGLLGFQLPKNFNAPYLATSIIDFWHRWHISLSTWLRDYLYIPLGGNRHGELMRYRNLMLTMLLGGLWHGAAWTFVIWGGLHGLALSANHLWRDKLGKSITTLLGWALTLWFVCYCWIFFRSPDFATASYVEGIFRGLTSYGSQSFSIFIIALPAILFFIHFSWQKCNVFQKIECMPDRAFTVFIAIITICAIAFIPSGYKPFIYFQF